MINPTIFRSYWIQRQQMRFKICYLKVPAETYRRCAYGPTKSASSLSTAGPVPFTTPTPPTLVLSSTKVKQNFFFPPSLRLNKFIPIIKQNGDRFRIGDCHNDAGQPDMCVAGAIRNFTTQLTTYRTQGSDSPRKWPDPTRCTRIIQVIWKLFNLIFIIVDNLTEALLFLSHFVGDIHQVKLKLFKTMFICWIALI